MSIKVTLQKDGESVTTTIEDGQTIQALMEQGHLRGITTGAAFRVNGEIASPQRPLREGDNVNVVPTGGKLG